MFPIKERLHPPGCVSRVRKARHEVQRLLPPLHEHSHRPHGPRPCHAGMRHRRRTRRHAAAPDHLDAALGVRQDSCLWAH